MKSEDLDEVMEGDEGVLEVGRHRDVGREILETPISDLKRAAPVTVAPTATVARAAELMRTKRVSAVMVVKKRNGRAQLAGIFTERDLVNRALPTRGWQKAAVKKFMTARPEALKAKDAVAFAINKMSVGRFRHVPLVDESGAPSGMVSIRDIADFIVELLPEEILNLPPEPELAIQRKPEGE